MVGSFLTPLTKQGDCIIGFLTKKKSRGIRLNIIKVFFREKLL